MESLNITLKNKNCSYCGKTLVPIGDKRKNGSANHYDYAKRPMHLKCWKEFKESKKIGDEKDENFNKFKNAFMNEEDPQKLLNMLRNPFERMRIMRS